MLHLNGCFYTVYYVDDGSKSPGSDTLSSLFIKKFAIQKRFASILAKCQVNTI